MQNVPLVGGVIMEWGRGRESRHHQFCESLKYEARDEARYEARDEAREGYTLNANAAHAPNEENTASSCFDMLLYPA